MHAYWVSYLQQFLFILKHKTGQLNKVANSLSRRASLLVTMSNEVVCFEVVRELYYEDEYFNKAWVACSRGIPRNGYHVHNG